MELFNSIKTGLKQAIQYEKGNQKAKTTKTTKEELEEKYLNKSIKITKLDDPYVDYTGRRGIVRFIDDAGQLHGTWGGLAVIPEIDEFEVIENDN